MEENNINKLELLSNDELLSIEGGSEFSEKIMYYIGYAAGWLSSRNWSGTPAHKSALLGPDSRPIG